MLDSLKRWLSRTDVSGPGAAEPDDEVRRAPYALPDGVPALQQDPEQLRRRLLMGIALVAVAAGSAGFAFGRRAGTNEERRR